MLFEVPVIIGDGFVTTVTQMVVLYTYLTTLVLRPRLTLLPTPVTGNPQHCWGLSNTIQYFFFTASMSLEGVDVGTVGR